MSSTQTIPIPEELSVTWERSEDARAFWSRDQMHFPNPTTAIDEVMIRAIYRVGLNHGFTTYDVPLQGDYRRVWSYVYSSIMPRKLSDDEISAMGKRSEARLGEVMGRFMERWETDWLPEIKQHLDYWEQFNLQGASSHELIAHIDETVRRLDRLCEIHFEIMIPAQVAVSLFDEFVRDLFSDEDAFAAYRLIQGFDNLTVRGGSEAWRLSRRAMVVPEVRAILGTQPSSAVMALLKATDEGRTFLSAVQDYLNEFGRRGEIWGLSYATWIEDPTPAIRILQDYIRSDRDPDLELAWLSAQRDQLLAATRDRLRSYPEPVREQFEHLLKAATEGNILSEDHNYWIDFRACYEVRRVFMECGRRFVAAGSIEQADDIVHLTVDEVRETLARLDGPGQDRRTLVAERRAEIARFTTTDVPPAIGTMPDGPPPVNPMTVANGKFFGTPAQPSGDPRVLHGSAGSPGIVQGTARVIRFLADADRLKTGEILVAPTTAPPWTPLFATVAAVVTDTGGILSHCAVVAREYRIPAVVGTGTATSVIQDGQMIEVDGDQGIVRIVRD